MAINFRAGLDEIQQSGNVMGQGLAALTQQQSQAGQQMGGLIQQRQQRVAQNQQAKQQQSQQMFDSIVGAGETFAKIKNQQDALKRQEVVDGRATEEYERSKTANKAALAQKESMSAAILADNLKKGTDAVKIPDNITTPIEQAAYVSQANELSDKQKKAETDEKTRISEDEYKKQQTAASKAGVAIARETLNFNKKNDDYTKALEESNNLVSGIEKTAKKVMEKDGIYTANESAARVKNHEEVLKTVNTKNASLNTAREITSKLFEVAGDKIKPNMTDDEKFKTVSQTINSMADSDPNKAEAKFLYGKLLFSAKQPGMGQISDSEYSIMGGMSGAAALEATNVIGNPAAPILKRFWAAIELNSTREANMVALGRKMKEQEKTSMQEIVSNISNSGGLDTIDKERRTQMIFEAIPKETKEKMNYADFSNLGYKEQLTAVFGEKIVSKMSIQASLDKDYLNEHKSEAYEQVFKKALAWTPGRDMDKKDAEIIVNRNRNAINSIMTKSTIASKPTVSGVPVYKEYDSQYELTANADGSASFTINGNGIMIPVGNNFSQRVKQNDPYSGITLGNTSKPKSSSWRK